MVRYVVVLWLLACQGGAVATAPPVRPVRHGTVDPLRQAHDYERGRGVVRDYAKAAEIYRQRCDGGAGDLAACRRLLLATLAARGVPRYAGAYELAVAMCQRDDLLGCLLADAGGRGSEESYAKLQRLIEVPCDAAHRARCEIERSPFQAFSQSGTVESMNQAFDRTGCDLGVPEACQRLRRSRDGDDHATAVKVLAPLCALGDADACEAVDTPLPARVRCDAHDFAACLALGCAGDMTAALAGLANHAGNCNGSLDEPPIATGIQPSARTPFDSLELRPVGDPAIGYMVYNLGTRPIRGVVGEIYGYDAGGAQVAREHFELREGPAPGAATLVILERQAARREPCISSIIFEDQVVHRARCPGHKPPGIRWGDGRDNVVIRAAFPAIPLADAERLEEKIALAFELTHPGIYVETDIDAPILLASESTEPSWIAQREQARGPQLALPLVLEPTSIVYRLDHLPGLRFSARTLAGIFSGAIKRWNDPAIARDNPGRTLPDLAIQVLQPGSPNDEVRVTGYLTRFAPRGWKLGVRRIAPLFPGAMWASLQRDQLDKAIGAISYVAPGLAQPLGLEVALVEGAGGAYVAPTAAAVSSGAYPIASPRTLYVPQSYASAELADAARQLVDWLLGDGLAMFEQLGYARPRPQVTEAARAQLQRIDVRPPAPPSEPYVDGELTIRIRVLGPGGRPSAGARVVHRSAGVGIDLDRPTRGDGTLVVEHVRTAPQRYEIAVRGRDGAVGAAAIDIGKPGRADARVTLRASRDPAVLHVRVLDKQRKPVANADVSADGIEGVPTDARGDTAIALPDHRVVEIRVWASRGVSESQQVELPERAPTVVVVGQ